MTGKKKPSSTRQRSKRFRALKKAQDAVKSLRPIGPRLDRHERPVEPPPQPDQAYDVWAPPTSWERRIMGLDEKDEEPKFNG